MERCDIASVHSPPAGPGDFRAPGGDRDLDGEGIFARHARGVPGSDHHSKEFELASPPDGLKVVTAMVEATKAGEE
jgi:hypothetical protein